MPSLPQYQHPAKTKRWVAHNLAARMLAQPWTLPSIIATVDTLLHKVHPRTRAALAVRVFALGEDTYPPAPGEIVAFLIDSEFFRPKVDHIIPVVLDGPVFAPLPRFAGLALPALTTPAELTAWLGLSAEELDWFSDARNGQARARTPQLLHYKHVLVRKNNGSLRLLEAPKSRLKAIQRRILRDILAQVPVHDRAHGFVAGRSCLTGAQIHAGEAVVASFDLTAFFPSIAAPRVHGMFRALGYPWAVARHMTGLCTTISSIGVINRMSAASSDRSALCGTYGTRHLPQGAPTSPALANLLAWRLDFRLDGLARSVNGNYTRYADDLAFSGDRHFGTSVVRFGKTVSAILSEEGFSLNHAKTRIMPCQQSQRVTGLVVNDHLNIRRTEFDTLKAILHNCLRGDPDSQNRAGVVDFRRHLEGRLAWVEQVNPHRGAKLRQVFDQIEWNTKAQ